MHLFFRVGGSILIILNKKWFKMEACLGVEREVKKVLDKFTSLTSSNAKAISETQNLLRSAKNDVQTEGKLKKL
jgi:hypothetical protein